MRDTRENQVESKVESDDHVGFEHSFFLTPKGAYFRLSEHTGEPVFVINMGDGPTDEAVLPFPGIKSEFAIADDSADGRMMALVGAGLEFVKALRLGDPLPQEIELCEPILIRQIGIIKPEIICALGRIAGQTLLRTKSTLGALRGRVHDYHGVKLIVTYHPAALLRNSNWKAPAWEDLKFLRREYDGMEIT